MHDYTMRKPGIYKLTCVQTGMIYVGSSVDMGQRWWKHFNDVDRNNCKKLANAIRKHGSESFHVEPLETIDQNTNRQSLRQLLVEREQYYLDLLQPFGQDGYNIVRVAGSNLGHKHTDEQKQAWSKMKRGKNNPMYGKVRSHEAIRQSSEKNRGQKRTPEQRSKMGKHRAKPVQAFDKNTGELMLTFPSKAEAARSVGADPSALHYCLRQTKLKTHKGYIWRYVD